MGKAAEPASMEKAQFLPALDQYGVPAIDYDEDDFRREIEQINT
jgi:predicted HTH domain antitoxin